MQDMNFDIQEKNDISSIARLVIIISSAVMMISTILPYARVELFGQGYTFNFLIIEGQFGDGIFFVVLGTLAILFAAIQKKIPLLIIAILLLLIFIYELVHALDVKNTYGDVLHFKIGFYLVRIASLAVIGACICYFITKKVVKNTPSSISFTTIGSHLDEAAATPFQSQPVQNEFSVQPVAPEAPAQPEVAQEPVQNDPVSTEENL